MAKKQYEARIRVFCPNHQTVFETDLKSNIVCEIGDHEISKQFPSGEYWEFCCDCETFYRSEMQSGGKDSPACPVCEREPKLRFLCGECKTVASDSGEPTRSKRFQIASASAPVSPNCPGCGTSIKGDFTPHACQVMLTPLSSSRDNCPFCGVGFTSVIHGASASSESAAAADGEFGFGSGLICQQCGTSNLFDSMFCVNCGGMLASGGTQTIVSPVGESPSPMSTELSGGSTMAPRGRKLPSAKKKASPWLTVALPSLAVLVVLIVVIVQMMPKSNSSTAENKPVSPQALDIPDKSSKYFKGFIDGKDVEFTVTRDGNRIKGEVKFTEDKKEIKDRLDGELTQNGFEARGYQNEDSYALGTYKATYDKTRKIVGFWESNFGKKKYFEAAELVR